MCDSIRVDWIIIATEIREWKLYRSLLSQYGLISQEHYVKIILQIPKITWPENMVDLPEETTVVSDVKLDFGWFENPDSLQVNI